MRVIKLLSILLLLLTGQANATDVDDYQHAWVHKALTLQRQLDLNVPLAQATFLATHNSYNSGVYATAVRYLDPNQSRSLYDQLRMDVRAVELDVHTFFNTHGWPWQWSNELMLCHGQDNHLGCSTSDRMLGQGLSEIRDWLARPENQQEVLLIYIEDHIDSGWYDDAIDIINDQLGSLVYRPAGGLCQGIPMRLSKADILAAGKRVLLMTDGCDNGFNSWVYGGIGSHVNGFPTGDVEALSYPDCQSQRFSRSYYDSHIVRYYEDRTQLSATFGDPGAPITPAKVPELLDCGVNLIGFDKLTPFDGRLQAAVWSWNLNEPNDWGAGEDCAESVGNGHFNDLACSARRHFACKKPGSHDWFITAATGVWQAGDSACVTETAGEYRYAVPTNPYDNQKLIEAKSYWGLANVWLNYTDRLQEGKWLPGNLLEWSWAAAEPNNAGGNEDCAVSRWDGQFNDLNCGAVQQFACQSNHGNHWYVSVAKGSWSQGQAICSSETAAQYHFSVPANAAALEALAAAKASRGATSVWLNFSDQSQEGRWLASSSL